jgi:hypothetical protein
MAVGTVSGVDPADNWQLITSVTPSGTSVTFSSLTGYKHLWLVGRNVTKSASDFPAMRPNNDSSAGSYATAMQSVNNKLLLQAQSSSSDAFSGKIYDIDKSIPHKVEWGYDPGAMGAPQDCYTNPVPITSLVLLMNGSASYTGGTVYLYGIPA